MNHNKLWKILKERDGNTRPPYLSPKQNAFLLFHQLFSVIKILLLGKQHLRTSRMWVVMALCEPWTSRCYTGFRKSRGTRDQIANICWIIKKAREFQKNIYFCFIDYAKVFDCMDHNKLWKILEETGKPDHRTCLLRNQYASQEAPVRTGYGTTDWFQIGKGECQGCKLSSSLFNLYAEYIMRNTGLD